MTVLVFSGLAGSGKSTAARAALVTQRGTTGTPVDWVVWAPGTLGFDTVVEIDSEQRGS